MEKMRNNIRVNAAYSLLMMMMLLLLIVFVAMIFLLVEYILSLVFLSFVAKILQYSCSVFLDVFQTSSVDVQHQLHDIVHFLVLYRPKMVGRDAEKEIHGLQKKRLYFG